MNRTNNWIRVASRQTNAIHPSEYDIENQRPVDVWQGHEFPIFGNELTVEYRRFNRLTINPFFYSPIVLSYPFAIVFLNNAVVRGSNEQFYVGIIVLLGFPALTFTLVMIPHVLSFFPGRHRLKNRIETMLENLPFLAEDIVTLGGVFVLCLILIRRNLVGQCPEGTSIFELQGCNPFASTHGISSDSLFFLYVAPITVQIVIKNVSLFALCMSWIMIVAAVIFCLVFTQAWSDTLTVCLLVIVMTISFEVERLYRIFYMQQLSLKEQEKRTVKRTELQLSAEQKLMQERNEKALHDAETFQLRSLMGNVAHDLKTPLVSFCGDVDLLKMFFDALSRSAIREASAKLCANGGEFAIKPREIFQSLWSTSHFMLAAINRGQDYMKATNGVKLVPSNGTFELAETIDVVVRCTKQLFSEGRQLIVHPLPVDLCTHVISDSHWLLENLLCLISNALKYSDAGDVSVRFEFVLVADLLNSPRDAYDEGSVMAIESPPSVDLRSTRSVHDNDDSRDINYHIKITVEDRGIGIEYEKRKKLFGIFRQAQRSAGGTGLGLFSLHERVKALGGSCGVESRSDGEQGSAFWLCFPYRPDPDAAALLRRQATTSDRIGRQQSIESLESLVIPSAPITHPVVPILSNSPANPDAHITPIALCTDVSLQLPPISIRLPSTPKVDTSSMKPNPNAKNRTVLVTDDSPSILKVVTRLLVNNGYMVETANNGSKALEKLKKGYLTGTYDMLLTDIQMPILDGIECTKRFRAWEMDERNKVEIVHKEESAEGQQGLNYGLIPTRPRFLIIGFSANSDADTKMEGLAAGMDYFVDKPFNYMEFEKLTMAHWGKGKA